MNFLVLPIRLFYLVLFVLTTSAFACGGSVTFPLAAVTDSNQGGIVFVKIDSYPSAQRDILFSIPPYYAVDLQRSINDAAEYVGFDNCTIAVHFDSTAEYMEGPSAGLAFAVALYGIEHNSSFVNQPVITGGITSDGIIFPVGGLYEKAGAAAKNGAKSFVCPKSSVYDYVMLKQIENSTGMRVVQVSTFEDVLLFMLENKTPSTNETVLYEPQAENIDYYRYANFSDFVVVAKKMIERERKATEELRKSVADEWIYDYYNDLLKDSENLLAKGYPYTAANNVFLAYVDTKTLEYVSSGKRAIGEKKQNVRYCLSNLQRPKMSVKNLEWVAAFDLRKAWAEDNLAKANLSNGLVEEEQSVYHDLMYAEAWCLAADDFATVASKYQKEGEFKESALENLAKSYMERANSTQHDSDTQRRFEIAKKLYGEGKYAAAIFDFVYVSAMDKSKEKTAAMNEDSLRAEISKMGRQNLSFMWPNIYKSQAVFVARNPKPDYKTAYSLLLFSQELDSALGEIVKTQGFEENTSGSSMNSQQTGAMLGIPNSIISFEAAIVIFILFVVVVIYILLSTKRRSHEGKTNPSDRFVGRKRKPHSKS